MNVLKETKNINNKIKTNINPQNKKTKQIYKKCEEFCKNDYMKEQEKIFQKLNKNFKMPHKKRTKKQMNFDFNVCKKVFCNKKCEGFFSMNFRKIKNGFHKTYKNSNYKKRGAISGCVQMP